MSQPVNFTLKRIKQTGATSILALASVGCATYANDDRFRNSGNYSPAQSEDSNIGGADYFPYSGAGRGIDAAREAHRMYSPDRAEQLDGNCERVVRINRGETLSYLAEYCDVSVASIIAANPDIGDLRYIAVGQQFYIPEQRANIYEGYAQNFDRTEPVNPGIDPSFDDGADDGSYQRNANARGDNQSGNFHLVQRGDTLGDIAARYNVSVPDIVTLNPDVRPRNLEIGDRVYLPEFARTASHSGQADDSADSEPLLDDRRPTVSFSPVRGPRDGEIRLVGGNFGNRERVVILYGDHRDRLSEIRTIEADARGDINEIIRLPDDYQNSEAYFGMQRGNEVYVSETAYKVEFAEESRGILRSDYESIPGLLERRSEPLSAATLTATNSDVNRNDAVSLSAIGFPPNTVVAIYGGPSRDTLMKISAIRTDSSGRFETEVRVPDNVKGDTVLFVAAVDDGSSAYFSERVRVHSTERALDDHPEDRGVSMMVPEADGSREKY